MRPDADILKAAAEGRLRRERRTSRSSLVRDRWVYLLTIERERIIPARQVKRLIDAGQLAPKHWGDSPSPIEITKYGRERLEETT
jgi:hypothetical protein